VYLLSGNYGVGGADRAVNDCPAMYVTSTTNCYVGAPPPDPSATCINNTYDFATPGYRQVFLTNVTVSLSDTPTVTVQASGQGMAPGFFPASVPVPTYMFSYASNEDCSPQ
jgi:hypothetical protein